MGEVLLRETKECDLDVFFAYQQDADACHMAAFVSRDPKDRALFDAHWAKMMSDEAVVTRTILFDGMVAGHIAKWERDAKPEVTYWIGKEHWGKGIASRALAEFLNVVTVRPLFGGAAKDNVASICVLEKNGFAMFATMRGFADARGEEIEEVILRLE